MRLTFAALGHTLTFALEGDDPDEPAPRDTTLDAMVERAGGERDPGAELDYRTRMGFRP